MPARPTRNEPPTPQALRLAFLRQKELNAAWLEMGEEGNGKLFASPPSAEDCNNRTSGACNADGLVLANWTQTGARLDEKKRERSRWRGGEAEDARRMRAGGRGGEGVRCRASKRGTNGLWRDEISSARKKKRPRTAYHRVQTVAGRFQPVARGEF